MKRKSTFIVAGLTFAFAAFNFCPSLCMRTLAEEDLRNCVVINDNTDKTFESISDAVDHAKNGDKITVYPGTYTENVEIDKDGITVTGLPGAVIDGTGINLNKENEALFYIQAKGISVSNLEFTGLVQEGPSTGAVPKAIAVDEGSEDITVSGCTIHDMGVEYTSESQKYNAHGIYVEAQPDNPVKNVKILKNTVYNLTLGQSEAIVVNGNVDGFEISENYVHDCDNIGIDAIGYEQDGSENDRAHNGSIHDNTVVSISSGSNPTYEGDACADGIYVDGGYDIDIFNNYVSDSDIGIEVSTEHHKKITTGVDVYNNILINNNRVGGITLGGYDSHENGSIENCKIYNNTVYNTAKTCLNIQYACSSTNEIHNNIFIASANAEIYTEYLDDLSRGNTIKDNMTSPAIHAEGYTPFNLTGITPSNRTVVINTPDDLTGYGADWTVINH